MLALKKKERFDIVSKGFNITAILVFLTSMFSINHAYADGHRVDFCTTPYKGFTHNECLTAINKGVRLYQNCSRYNCEASGSKGFGMRTKTDNSIRFLYDGKWFNIMFGYDNDKKRYTTQCFAFYMTPCTD